jgi:hypothetical protein
MKRSYSKPGQSCNWFIAFALAGWILFFLMRNPMKLEQTIVKTKPEQAQGFRDYCEAHGITPAIAGRIAFARLLSKKPTKAEIKAATVPRGNLDTLRQNQGD